jgi:hypothetical protein
LLTPIGDKIQMKILCRALKGFLTLRQKYLHQNLYGLSLSQVLEQNAPRLLKLIKISLIQTPNNKIT